MARGATAGWQRLFSVSIIPFMLEIDSAYSRQTHFTKTLFFI